MAIKFSDFKYCVSTIGIRRTMNLHRWKSEFAYQNGWCVVDAKFGASQNQTDPMERYKLIREAATQAEDLTAAKILYQLDYG